VVPSIKHLKIIFSISGAGSTPRKV